MEIIDSNDLERITNAATPVHIPDDILDVFNDCSDYNNNLFDKNFLSYINDDTSAECANVNNSYSTQMGGAYEAQVGNSFPMTGLMNNTYTYNEYGVASPANTVNTIDEFSNPPKGTKRTKSDKCMSKNAIAARQNRIKKKYEQENKEKQLENCQHEVKILRESQAQLQATNSELRARLDYYENVIGNIPAVLQLVNRIEGGGGEVNTNGGLLPETLPAIDAGVCLHIQGRKITLEFCHMCASKKRIKMENNT